MTEFRRLFSRQWLPWTGAALAALLLAGGWWWLESNREEGQYPIYLIAGYWLAVLIFLLWGGNTLIYHLLRQNYPWEAAFNRRFILQLLATLLYTLACINLTYWIFKTQYTQLPPDRNQMLLLNIYGILFLLPVLSIQFGLLFVRKWKRALVKQEQMKKEQIRSELLTLKSHLSPHFLFNNLNILSALIQPGNHQAQDFLDRFSEVYRYVLRSRDTQLVTLCDELEFVQHYRYLLEQRFREGLQVDLQVDQNHHQHLMPPLALQMVLENALKHNRLSEAQPLCVHIFTTGKPSLVVRNNLQRRPVTGRKAGAYGLDNIRKRYRLIARQEIGVEETDTHFSVELPLIIQTRYESNRD